MKKIVYILAFGFPVMFVILAIYMVMDIISYIQQTESEMDNLINYSVNYNIASVQDPDVYNTSVSNTSLTALQSFGYDSGRAALEYTAWLNDMKHYKKATYSNGVSISSSSSPTSTDDIFVEIIELLSGDLGALSRYNYTPINFGITYINTELLEAAMKQYIHDLVTETHIYLSFDKNGKFNINPDTVDIEAIITATPYNLGAATDETEYLYKVLFGEDYDNTTAIASDNRTMLRYNIELNVEYDMIPKYGFFRIPTSVASGLSAGAGSPPDGMYFPLWDMGSTVNGYYTVEMVRTYNFEYILVN